LIYHKKPVSKKGIIDRRCQLSPKRDSRRRRDFSDYRWQIIDCRFEEPPGAGKFLKGFRDKYAARKRDPSTWFDKAHHEPLRTSKDIKKRRRPV
jgi:hypothetical protein